MAKNKRRIVLRADGNETIGLGHIMRLLALVEILKNEFNFVFLIRRPDEKIAELIKSKCQLVSINRSAQNEISQIEQILQPSDIVVLDGYDFHEKYQILIKSKVHKLVMINDKVDIHFYADLVINHGCILSENIFKKEPYTRLLTGIRYLILRKEFLKIAQEDRKINKIDSVFICFGGSDPFNMTVKFLKAAQKCEFIKKITIVTGSEFTNQEELEKILHTSNKYTIYENNVDAKRLIKLIKKCQIAICPSSTVALEVCCVKAGILTGMVIDNQTAIHNLLVSSKCVLTLTDLNKASEEQIRKKIEEMNDIETISRLIKNQAVLFDGNSRNNILKEFRALSK